MLRYRNSKVEHGAMSGSNIKSASFIIRRDRKPSASSRSDKPASPSVTKMDGHTFHVLDRTTLQKAIRTAMKEYA